MVNRLHAFIVFAILCIALHANAVSLKKVHFHEGASRKDAQGNNIELGNMLLYFDEAPRVESSVVDKNDTTLHVLFLPNATLSSEAQASLEDLRERAQAHACRVKFTQKNDASRKGIEIAMVYPSCSMGVRCDHFKTMKLQKGIRLQLYNKQLLHRIKQVGKSIITTAALQAPRVFIDCGHGGSDCGAVCNAIQEKDLTLTIGLSLAEKLRKSGLHVMLSRDKDLTLALDKRTSNANQSNADVFVSIHANATSNAQAEGIETYFFHPSTLSFLQGDSSSMSHLFAKQHSDACAADRCKQSTRLAHTIHSHLISSVSNGYTVKDRQVKLAPFQVLLGTQMPSVLVEVGFITHPEEAQRLSSKSYQEKIADGIATGITQFLKAA